ncbi:SDR family NAD(P)-dependent oxidoreductase [Pseudomonas sp. MF6755]|uniref:SDR family NAD(P)-dependent oxidoreductase n=1 Tax=Pseudomonas sp. MF6755 TaxID=2797530 RepID=UPI0018E73DCF|nr:SDR family NAD(P)-dependent oxidoreductase [Pseudomonas sp. MF6755]MBJ2285846.1 SDR family NAD(P)-dependent oxidoreductase [Pseudomonas sp. MF6755]
MDTQLKGRVALVSGGDEVIGEGVARVLHHAGAKVALLARGKDRLKKIAADLGDGAFAISCDITTAEGLAHAIEATQANLGAIDIVVNIADVLRSSTSWPVRPYGEIPDGVWTETWEFIRLINALAPRMAERGWGRIINITSDSDAHPEGVTAEYASAKCAQSALTKGLARTFAPQGVLVNVVSPAYVASHTLRDLLTQQSGP